MSRKGKKRFAGDLNKAFIFVRLKYRELCRNISCDTASLVNSYFLLDFHKDSLLGHIEGSEFEEIVNAIFEHHTMSPCPFGCIDERPDVFRIHSGGYFYGYVLTYAP